jgi:hypothetical protein
MSLFSEETFTDSRPKPQPQPQRVVQAEPAARVVQPDIPELDIPVVAPAAAQTVEPMESLVAHVDNALSSTANYFSDEMAHTGNMNGHSNGNGNGNGSRHRVPVFSEEDRTIPAFIRRLGENR